MGLSEWEETYIKLTWSKRKGLEATYNFHTHKSIHTQQVFSISDSRLLSFTFPLDPCTWIHHSRVYWLSLTLNVSLHIVDWWTHFHPLFFYPSSLGLFIMTRSGKSDTGFDFLGFGYFGSNMDHLFLNFGYPKYSI